MLLSKRICFVYRLGWEIHDGIILKFLLLSPFIFQKMNFAPASAFSL